MSRSPQKNKNKSDNLVSPMKQINNDDKSILYKSQINRKEVTQTQSFNSED